MREEQGREEIRTGWTNRVIKVSTLGGDYIFRFPKTPFWEEVIVREAKSTKFLSKYIKTAEQRLLWANGHPYTMHKCVPGRPLSEVFPLMSRHQRQEIANDIVCYLSSLQKIPSKGQRWERLSSFLARLAVSTGIPGYDYSTFDELKRQECTGNLVICHGDFNSDNIIVSEQDGRYKLAVVIDYAFCTLSSPFADIARICNRLPAIRKYILTALIDMWDYVDANYRDYMRNDVLGI